MARPAKNLLHIDPLVSGGWILQGYFRGRQIRQRSHDITKLETRKATLEQQLLETAQSEATRDESRRTWMSVEQVQDAEAAHRMAKGRRLVECVAAADRVLPPVAGMPCAEALTEWLLTLAKRKRSEITAGKNERRVKAFLRDAKAKNLEDIRPRMIEDWVYREGGADYTRITDAQVVRAWLNFCTKRRWLLVSPFELDMKDMSATARTVEPARILAPETCHGLLIAAGTVSDGVMLPYALLATWCFMSPQEIIRTTRAKMKLDAATPVIEVDTVKRRTAKFRTVTVPANVVALLRAAVDKWPAMREVLDKKTKKKIEVPFTVPFSRSAWDRVRMAAGLLARDKPTKRGRRGTHKESEWQGSILRHTGLSYFFQSLAARAQKGEFNEKSVIAEVCRQAGNASDTAFRHYLSLPVEGASERFYAMPVFPAE